MRILNQAGKISVFIAGILFIALGVTFATKANLGTSPITAIPYSLSLCFDVLSFGNWVILFNLMLIFFEWLLLRGTLSWVNLGIQTLLTFLFGYCIELFMWLFADFTPEAYWHQISAVICGCAFIAFGVCLNILSNVSVMPGDGFSMAVSTVAKKEFGRVRLLSDITMSATALAICLLFLGGFAGVREGTAIAAVCTSIFVMWLMRLVKRLLAARERARRTREAEEAPRA